VRAEDRKVDIVGIDVVPDFFRRNTEFDFTLDAIDGRRLCGLDGGCDDLIRSGCEFLFFHQRANIRTEASCLDNVEHVKRGTSCVCEGNSFGHREFRTTAAVRRNQKLLARIGEWLGSGIDCDHGDVCGVDKALCNASQEKPLQSTPSVGWHHHQLDARLRTILDNRLVGVTVEYLRDHVDTAFCRALGCFVHDLCSVLLQSVTHIFLHAAKAVVAGVYDIEDVDRCLVFGGYLEGVLKDRFCWLAPVCGKEDLVVHRRCLRERMGTTGPR